MPHLTLHTGDQMQQVGLALWNIPQPGTAGLTVDLPWQTGDVALVENYVTMRGRRNVSETRRVQASLVQGEA